MATFSQENIHLAFQHLLPLSEYHLFSDDYSDVEWMDSRTQPTKAAVNTAIPLAIAAEKWIEVRAERDKKLSASDWMALPDSPAISDSWAEYRQALRNVGNQSDPENITWPTEPS